MLVFAMLCSVVVLRNGANIEMSLLVQHLFHFGESIYWCIVIGKIVFKEIWCIKYSLILVLSSLILISVGWPILFWVCPAEFFFQTINLSTFGHLSSVKYKSITKTLIFRYFMKLNTCNPQNGNWIDHRCSKFKEEFPKSFLCVYIVCKLLSR